MDVVYIKAGACGINSEATKACVRVLILGDLHAWYEARLEGYEGCRLIVCLAYIYGIRVPPRVRSSTGVGLLMAVAGG